VFNISLKHKIMFWAILIGIVPLISFFYFNQSKLKSLRLDIQNELTPVSENLLSIHQNNMKIKNKYALLSSSIQLTIDNFSKLSQKAKALDEIENFLNKEVKSGWAIQGNIVGDLVENSIHDAISSNMKEDQKKWELNEEKKKFRDFVSNHFKLNNDLKRKFESLFPINAAFQLPYFEEYLKEDLVKLVEKMGYKLAIYLEGKLSFSSFKDEDGKFIDLPHYDDPKIANSYEIIDGRHYFLTYRKFRDDTGFQIGRIIIALDIFDFVSNFERKTAQSKEINNELAELSQKQEQIKQETIITNDMIRTDLEKQAVFIEDNLGALRRSLEGVSVYNKKLIKTSFFVLVFVFIIIFICSIAITYSLTRPVNKAIDGLKKVSEQVAAASSEVSKSNQQVADGASEQATASEETSTSLKETASMSSLNANNANKANNLMEDTSTSIEVIANMTGQNADNAIKANELMNETSSSLELIAAMTYQNAQNAETANKLMKNTNNAVEDAGISMNKLFDFMKTLANTIEKTSGIIKTIESIAVKTNFLALNASMQANRAGKAGTGFAVVAREVRKLAVSTGDAARNTGELIQQSVEGIKNGLNIVSKTNNNFSKLSEDSKKLSKLFTEITKASKDQANEISQISNGAKKIRNLLNDIANASREQNIEIERINTGAKEVYSLLSDIAAASQDQALGIGYIDKAMVEMDSITQRNVVSTEETATASEEISKQMNEVKELVQELVIISGLEKMQLDWNKLIIFLKRYLAIKDKEAHISF